MRMDKQFNLLPCRILILLNKNGIQQTFRKMKIILSSSIKRMRKRLLSKKKKSRVCQEILRIYRVWWLEKIWSETIKTSWKRVRECKWKDHRSSNNEKGYIEKCRFKFKSTFTEQSRIHIFNEFWGKESHDKKWEYITRIVLSAPVAEHTVNWESSRKESRVNLTE